MSKLHQTAQTPARQVRTLTVAPFEGFDRMASLPVQQEVIDDQLAELTEGELKIMLAITRATNGGQRESVPLSVRILCNGGTPDALPGRGTGLSPRTVQAACTTLETAGFLRIARRIAPDGSGLPSLFTLPLVVPGMRSSGEQHTARFPGYAAGRRVRLPLLVYDRLLVELSGAELKVLLYILRHTFCVGAADEIMPMARLVENTGLSLRHARLAVGGLTTRGVVLVQHRQDSERGKLPSRFGVKVIGEAPPFTSAQPSTGNGKNGHIEEQAQDQSRPFWLVPAVEPAMAPGNATETSSLTRGDMPDIQLATGPQVLERAAPAENVSAPLTIAPPKQQAPRQAAPVQHRSVPAALTRDNSPIWEAAKQILAVRLPYQVFMDRIASTASVGNGGPELLIAVQDEYHRWWLESKLGRQVRDALAEAGHADVRMRYLNYNGTVPRES